MDDCNRQLIALPISFKSSDSSMDDCNRASNGYVFEHILGSDSSMDDCNAKKRALVDAALLGSDSSMDDCNGSADANHESEFGVQIPLWTIVTPISISEPSGFWISSDSSMDDCNGSACSCFSSSRDCSDSSMDDCNTVAVNKADVVFLFRFLYGRL